MVVALQPLVPEPQRKSVLLVNDQRHVTRHRFLRSELVDVGAGITRSKAYAFIFRCEVTGVERRFGLESPISRPTA
jgi:hypothetical protein